jgi:lysophospholipase D
MCGGTGGKLHETHAHELPKINPPPEQRQNFKDDDPRHSEIPTLEAVLQDLPHHIHLVVEFKTMNGDVIKKVYDLLLKYNRVNGSTAWFSLDLTINETLRKHCNKMPTINSVKEMLHVYILYYTGLLPFVPLSELDIFGFPGDPVDKKRVKHNLKHLPDWVCHILAFLAGGEPAPFFLCEPLIRHLKLRGIPVQVLGVNSHEALQAAKQVGVTAVLTDRPRWLGSIRDAKGTIFH